MRIAVDARTLFTPSPRGIGKTLLDLYRCAAEIKPNWNFTLYHRKGQFDHIPKFNNNVETKTIEIPGDRFDAWQQLRLPFAAWADKADLLHCPANSCPKIKTLPTVVTIHDIIPLDRPKGIPETFIKQFRLGIKNASTNADTILTPSNYTRKRLIQDFKISPNKIQVNPWAPSQNLEYLDNIQRRKVLTAMQLQKPYILHFGAKDERKNTEGMINAWAMTDKTVRQYYDLFIVGVDEQTRLTYIEKAKRLGIASSIYIESYLPDNFLSSILSGATALAYPSFSEGFGLPIIDAWTTRTPVITSKLTSLPEVARDGVVYIDPSDPCSIARVIKRIISEPILRQRLISKGLTHAKKYSWMKTAHCLIDTFENILNPQTTHLPTPNKHQKAA